MSEKIMTLHPAGKQGVNISKAKYDVIKDAIFSQLSQAGELTFTGLTDAVKAQLGDSFDGSVGWYVTTVKLDLEAQGLIERIPGHRPQMLQLTSGG